MIAGDTIAAISSAVGPAARMIVRLSGPEAHQIASQIAERPDDRIAFVRAQFDGLTFQTWLYTFHAPHSYTGEDTVEFHLPGNPLLARMLLDELMRRGARAAEPGEFTARAYFNGRLDLTQAEGVAASIAASSEAELRAARQLLAGELARRVKPALDSLADTLALIEVGIDFSEEEVPFLSSDQIRTRLDAIDAALRSLMLDSARIERMHHTPQIVLIGKPNAGKSTLLNALAGEQRAVVSSEPGTTRDALSADVALERGVVRIIDVAGVEDDHLTQSFDQNKLPSATAHANSLMFKPTASAPLTGHPRQQAIERITEQPTQQAIAEIEKRMREQALSTVEKADFVIVVKDSQDHSSAISIGRAADLRVLTKLDLSSSPDAAVASAPPQNLKPSSNTIAVSAKSGQNMGSLRHQLDAMAFGVSTGNSLAINARHVQLITEARAAIERAHAIALTAGAEVVAVELRDALDALGKIVGQVTPDDVLGRVFSAFCIGK